jgi:hypothetical protein
MGIRLIPKNVGIFKSYLVLSLLCSLSYPIVFFLAYEATAEMLLCSMVHALSAAIVAYKIISDLFVKAKYRLSIAAMFIVVNLIYFNASSIKYFETELYPGFIDQNIKRLMYSLLALFVLWLSFEFVVRITRHRPIATYLRNRKLLKIVFIGLLSLNCIDMYRNYRQKGIGYNYIADTEAGQLALERTEGTMAEKTQIWLVASTSWIMILLAALLQSEKNNTIYLVMALVVCLISSIISGNRSSLFYFVISLGFSLSYLYGYKNKLFAKVLFAAPLMIGLGSIIILALAARVSSNYTDTMKQQLAYRFDLTDYGATIIGANNLVMLNLGQIKDAFYYSVPKILYPDKYQANKKSIYGSYFKANLSENIDYTDTYFSVGSQLAGVVGFILFPIGIICILYGVEQLLQKCFPAIACYIVVLIGSLYLSVEADLNSIMANWRMLPLYIIFGALVCALFVKKHRHSYSTPNEASKIFEGLT